MNDAHSRHLEGVKKAKCSEITKKYVLQSKGRFRQCHGRSSERGERKTLNIKMIPACQPLNGNKVITDVISLKYILGKIPSESNFQEYGKITT